MQLRVARLCLDCEELYVGTACPVCASERYAFISKWLPSEERRRWRRPARKSPPTAKRLLNTAKQIIARGLGDEIDPAATPGVPKTRASDFVPDMDFEEPTKEPQKAAARSRQPLKGDVR